MICKVESKYWHTTHKFGIELPKNVKDAVEIDKKTGTNFWGGAIEKERKKSMKPCRNLMEHRKMLRRN
jgi:hypothetical protein